MSKPGAMKHVSRQLGSNHGWQDLLLHSYRTWGVAQFGWKNAHTRAKWQASSSRLSRWSPRSPMAQDQPSQGWRVLDSSLALLLEWQAHLFLISVCFWSSDEMLGLFRAWKATKCLAPQSVHLDRHTLNPESFWHLHSWGLCVPWISEGDWDTHHPKCSPAGWERLPSNGGK